MQAKRKEKHGLYTLKFTELLYFIITEFKFKKINILIEKAIEISK